MVFLLCALLVVLLFFIVKTSFCNNKQFVKKTTNDNFEDNIMKELEDINPDLYKIHFNPSNNESKNYDVKPDLIFVSIASYRDNQCSPTFENIVKNADKPENLRIVICQQNSIFEKDCLKWCKKEKGEACSVAKIERLSHLQAKGPTWARWRVQREWTGEEYFLQIDSHTRMVPHWDTILKEQLELCPSNKPVLTQYPLEYDIVEKGEGDQKEENWRVDTLRSGLYVQKFGEPDRFIRIQSDYTTTIRRHPWSSTCWAAGFSFSKGEFIKEAGYDPCTPFLFFGEEMDIAIRAFTHGWDFFSPSVNVAFHNYKREHRSTFWENPQQKPLEVLSRFRIYVRLGYIKSSDIPIKYKFILNGIENFPLGKERTIEEWEKMSKASIKSQSVNH